jgi:2-polyprenyl-3-methyl-5-hydroxy-6-metoxy-1,4-benzoquinol methylase
MSTTRSKSLAARLRASPNFVLAFTLDGKPYVAKETEPYTQYWLSERYRILLSMFSTPKGATAEDAVAQYLRFTGAKADAPARRRLLKAVDDMRGSGVVVDVRDDTSRYDARIVDAYVAHRPFPPEVAAHLIAQGGVGSGSRVLDLAGGPGDLALALAAVSHDVSLMELSKGFLAAATRRAKRQGVAITPIHDSCNRLIHRDDEYDVMTISQALHWLDDVLVCRGVCRMLRAGGSFFVIHSAIDLDNAHPLAWLLGHDSILGAKKRQSFAAEVQPILRRLSLLFEALDAPDVQRVDPTQQGMAPGSARRERIVPAGVSLFRQRRPFELGYARGFLTPRHIELTGRTPEAFWQDAEARCAGKSVAQLLGHQHWAVLQFRRGGARVEARSLKNLPVADIGFTPATAKP